MTTINAQINPSTRIVAKSVTLHDVSAESVGLGNVDNTSDINKPVSTATQTALDLKANQSTTQAALDLKADQSTTYTKTEVDTNIANLVDTAPAALDTLNELAAALGDDANFATNVTNSIATKASQADLAITTTSITNLSDAFDEFVIQDGINRVGLVSAISDAEAYTATVYQELNTHTSDTTNPHSVTKTQVGLGNVEDKSAATIIGEIVDSDIPSTITRDSELSAHTSLTTNPHSVTKSQVGLGNVNNTSDANKPVSTATQTALDLKADDSNVFNVSSSSSTVTNFMGASNSSEALNTIGSNNYPFTTTELYQYEGSLDKVVFMENVVGSLDFAYAPILAIHIGSNVTSIAVNGFIQCDYLTNITIPSTVTTIGSSAFRDCAVLTDVIMQDGVTSLGRDVFNSCTQLENVRLSNNLTELNVRTFANCVSLLSITIPDSVDTISTNVFYNCTSLADADIGDGVLSIGNNVFFDCSSLTSVSIGSSVQSIGNNVFYNCDLTSVDIPSSITSLGNNVFGQNTNLSVINCRALAAPTLGSSVFLGVAATEIHVPVGATGYGTTYGGLTVVADL